MKGRIAEGRLQVLQLYRLLQYVNEGDKVRIEKMVKLGVDDLINLIEPRDWKGALHLAAATNNQELLSFLISQGARPNTQDRKGRTPAMLAAGLGHDAMLALLAENHADMNLLDAEGKGVLFYCIQPTKHHARCLQVALQHRADVNILALDGTSVFLLSCEKAQDCSSMCLDLLKHGADPNVANHNTGMSALMLAARIGSLQLVRAVLQKGGQPNAMDAQHHSAVHYAAMGGFFEVIQLLSAYSADMGVMTSEGNTALHYAAATGHANCCRFLTQRGCNPKVKNAEGLLPRQIARDAGHKAATKELRRVEWRVKRSGTGAVTPWAVTLHDWSHEHQAALRGAVRGRSETVSTERFEALLERMGAPADPDQIRAVVQAHDRRREGRVNVVDFLEGVKYVPKAFLVSSYVGKKKKAKKSGKAGTKKAKPSVPLPICTLPPGLICRRADGGPPHFLIQSYRHCTDASRFDRDHPPRHPIEDDSAWYLDEPERVFVDFGLCVKTGDLESLGLAFAQGVPVDVKDRYYKTPLMVACASGNYEVAQYLLRLGADVKACDQFLWTPLHHAAHAGRLDLLQLLVAAGASVDTAALSGATPLMRAIESSRPCCVDFLLKAGAKVTAQNKTGQQCLDIARAYGDARVIELIKNKMDSLPKPKVARKGKRKEPQAKPRAPALREKASAMQTPAPAPPPAVGAGGSTSLRESDDIILQNTRITSGGNNTVDISFLPRTVWGNGPTTSQLTTRKVNHRESLSVDVDFEDFPSPFKNLHRTSRELSENTD